nr:endochitinase EP3-like [Tanacetum cinerariifolium]
MDDPNITMEEYIRLEKEKARRNAKVFNEAFTSKVTPSYEPTMVIYDESSFSYKTIYVNDLKTDSKNDNDKVKIPSFPSPGPEVSYYNDLDFFKDFEKEFPAIVYNDALTSKSDFLTEPTVSHQHIDEFNSKDDTSFSRCDEKEQCILYFNDLCFNVIYPDDLKSDKDNDDDKIDIKQPLGDMSIIPLPNALFNGIKDQSATSCEGRGFYTRDAFFPATGNYRQFGRVGLEDDSKLEIVAFFAHVTHETGYFCHIEEVNGPSKDYCNESNTQYPFILSGQGFGATIRAINGMECNGGDLDTVTGRVSYYNQYCSQLGVAPGGDDPIACLNKAMAFLIVVAFL